ncbi:NAD(P)/FAD-dependent oxidoreductase [Thermaerobacter subterraneus]|uniref:Glycine/D-amino acid oxidase, deaminating n=1 Tax=Thermaerobacter subterraneus DSM 13965 TaxID=867903 RepID=K6QF27_9FIRM|nr:FAD-binding oxidoreductase [Thermaerobacter subterraneus]EKP95526.1 glycine/D-amino acid oxidase, deaminating [Thermaerobacter subterraneus DSM 13965]
MQFEVVIVGGGIAGLQAAWHLRETGIRRIAVIEQGAVGGGATAHGAGFLSHFTWNPLDAHLVRRSAELYAAQQAELGGSFFRVTGSYVVVSRAVPQPGASGHGRAAAGMARARTRQEPRAEAPAPPHRAGEPAQAAATGGQANQGGELDQEPMDEAGREHRAEQVARQLAARAAMVREAGIAVHDLTPAEGATAVPAWNWADVEAAWFVPGDGTLLPGEVARTLARRLRQREVAILEETPALELGLGHGAGGPAVAGVRTPQGPVAADAVVVATGVWTRRLLQTAGLDAPIKPYRTQLSFWALPGDLDPSTVPPLHDVTGEYYWLPREGFLAVGDGTQLVEQDPAAFRREPDPEFIAACRARLEHRLPAARGAELVRGWAHLCDATPDRRPLLGPYGGVEGLHLAVGFNGFGVMRAPAVGELVARFVLGEEPALGGRPLEGTEALRASRFSGYTDFEMGQGFNTAGEG